jgi:glutamyl-tRNA reductase
VLQSTACESQKTDLLGLLSHLTDSSITNEVEAREDAEAVRHLFSVAAGLDSLVIGESEILGQVKTAYEQAKSCGLTGKRLNVLFQRALYVGKKVRSETGIASGSMSVPSVAVQLAETIFGKLEGKSALVLGAGAMAELAAKHLVARGIESLRVANRTWQRAYALAARFQGDTCPWEDFPTALIHADVVISSTGAPQAVITRPMVVEAMEHRAGRSLFLIDIAMPRDIEQSDMENYYNQQSKQQVINDSIVGWLSRKDNKIDDILNLERKLNDVLKKIENDKDKSSLKEHDEHFGRYIVDLMKKKYDQKYEQILNQEQKRLVQLFVEEKQEALKESLKDIKKRLQKVIFEKRKDMPYMINEKFDCILKDIDIENTVGIDEIKQHLLYIKLINNLYED